MSSHRRRYSKRELLGNLHVDYVMSVSDLGLVPGTNRWDVLRAFLERGEERVERLVEARDGFLIVQSIPGGQNTGGSYVYKESLTAFFWLIFGDHEDDLNGEDFQNACAYTDCFASSQTVQSVGTGAGAGDTLRTGLLLPRSRFRDRYYSGSRKRQCTHRSSDTQALRG